VAERSKAWVCHRLPTGIAGSKFNFVISFGNNLIIYFSSIGSSLLMILLLIACDVLSVFHLS
jgi:hypothetical protein